MAKTTARPIVRDKIPNGTYSAGDDLLGGGVVFGGDRGWNLGGVVVVGVV